MVDVVCQLQVEALAGHPLRGKLAGFVGCTVALRFEYAAGPDPQIHLCWESRSQELEHIPTECLYPVEGRPEEAQ